MANNVSFNITTLVKNMPSPYSLFSKIAAALCLIAAPSLASAADNDSLPGGHRLPNLGVGINHHTPDGKLCSSLNVGLRTEVDTLRGVQLGVLFSGIRGEAHGLMLSGLTNAAHYLNGFQVSGLANTVFTPMKGVQLSAMTNIAMGIERGMQLAGAANVSSGTMRGLQLAAYNYADTISGLQLGLMNVAVHHPKGVQIGIINYTHDTKAHKIGLVNLNPLTRIDFMGSIGSSSKLNGAIRFRNRSTYNILGVGTHYMGFDEDFSGALFYRIGQYFNLNERSSISGDLGFYHIETFHKNSSDSPARLYSLQARVNYDRQLDKTWGLFGSVGFGTTHHYGSHHNYRTRPLVESGLTYRYNANTSDDNQWLRNRRAQRQLKLSELEEMAKDTLYRFTDPVYLRRNWARGVGLTAGINVFVHCFDRFILAEDFAKVHFKDIARNWRNAFVWDNDQFSTNLFAHPYHGNLYFNSARSNGFSFWESAPFALAGSAMWEFCGEVEPPAINDLMATTVGGIALGEITHRISALLLNDRTRGFSRFLREFGATVINPMQGATRLMSGDAWKVRHEKYLYHDYNALPIEFAATLGTRYLADDGALFRGEQQPYVNFDLAYGNPFDEERTQPYDFFKANVTFGFTGNQPLVSGIHLLGRLWSTIVYSGKEGQTLVGLFQHFNYYDSEPVKDGSSLTPYRISEAAAFGPGIMWQFPKVGNIYRLEQSVYTSAILLGGSKSDYYNIIDRDYNMGSGFSVKSQTLIDFARMGRFTLGVEYYGIFTWKGYEGKDLETVNPLYLNAQGDRGNAQLLVVNPRFEVRLRRNIGLVFDTYYFTRRTHYRYYDDVRAKTFETRVGLNCRL